MKKEDTEFMFGKELSKAESYREKGDVQIHYNKLSLKLISISCYAFERYNHKEYEIVREIVNDIKKWCKDNKI